MAVLLSTNMYHAGNFSEVRRYIEDFDRRIGIEVFPMFHETDFEAELAACLPELGSVPISFHGPYYQAEHSAVPGTDAYRRTMELLDKTLQYAGSLKSRYLVYHHNNCRVNSEDKERMTELSCRNYETVNQRCERLGFRAVVENAGVLQGGNVLFTQEEFTQLCLREDYPVLIDVGHANANGWDLPKLMRDLSRRIVAYHLHNNDGIHDSHRRLHDGSMNVNVFLDSWRRNLQETGQKTDWVLEYSPDIARETGGIREDLAFLLKQHEAE